MRIPRSENLAGYCGLSACSQESPRSMLWQMADHQAAIIVVDSAPVRHFPGLAFFVGQPGFQVQRTRHLVALIQIVDRVEDRIRGGDIHDGAVGEHLFHAGWKDVPFDGAVEIVAHEEAAAQQVFAHGPGLLVGQVPVAHFHAVQPGPIVDVARRPGPRAAPRNGRGCGSSGAGPRRCGGRCAGSPWSSWSRPRASFP